MQRWELVDIFDCHKHDVFLMILTSKLSAQGLNLCDHEPHTRFHFSIFILWSEDEGSLSCDNHINYPATTENELHPPMIMQTFIPLSQHNEMMIWGSWDIKWKKIVTAAALGFHVKGLLLDPAHTNRPQHLLFMWDTFFGFSGVLFLPNWVCNDGSREHSLYLKWTVAFIILFLVAECNSFTHHREGTDLEWGFEKLEWKLFWHN